MSDLKKNLNVPSEYDPIHIKRMMEQVIDGTQGRYLSPVTSAPAKTDGKNGEMRIDHTNGLVYVKINGAWKSITPA